MDSNISYPEKINNIVFGIEGLTLTKEEKEFFKKLNPLGFIIFKRNIENKAQTKALIESLHECTNHPYTLILIDQEGGKVARLRPPEFRHTEPARYYGKLAELDFEQGKQAIYDNYLLMGQELAELGVNVNCAPIADLLYEEAHEIIGDRSFGRDPTLVASLCDAALQGLRDAKIEGIIKHIPGHGLANADSHFDLPIVSQDLEFLYANDFKVFAALANAKIAMTAHIIYQAIDAEFPATTSSTVIKFIRNELRFEGLLISDDLAMKALKDDIATNAQNAYNAGCDILLYCHNDLEEMEALAKVAQPLTESQLKLIANLSCFSSSDELSFQHELPAIRAEL